MQVDKWVQVQFGIGSPQKPVSIGPTLKKKKRTFPMMDHPHECLSAVVKYKGGINETTPMQLLSGPVAVEFFGKDRLVCT